MAAGSFEEGHVGVLGPDKQPITRIGHVALIPAAPATRKAMHVMALLQFALRLRRILQNEVNYILELR